MKFDFKITPNEKSESQKQKEAEEVARYKEINKRRALSADMQSTVVNMLNNNKNAAQTIPSQNVEAQKGW